MFKRMSDFFNGLKNYNKVLPSYEPQPEYKPEPVYKPKIEVIKWDWNTKLSEHFTLGEMVKVSNHNYLEKNYDAVTKDVCNSLKLLCESVLEPIRSRWGVIVVSSGFRCPEYNVLIGGAKTSQHVLGEACDFDIVGRERGKPLYEVFEWIYKQNGFKFGQVIYELDEWIHISIAGNRSQEKSNEAFVYEKMPDGSKRYRKIKSD